MRVTPPSLSRAVLAALFLVAGPSAATAGVTVEPALDGHAILAKNCGRCHAVDRTGASPLPAAPPLREIYRQRPDERLELEFSEGMGSRHPDMPQIPFSAEEIAAILTYLQSITVAE